MMGLVRMQVFSVICNVFLITLHLAVRDFFPTVCEAKLIPSSICGIILLLYKQKTSDNCIQICGKVSFEGLAFHSSNTVALET